MALSTVAYGFLADHVPVALLGAGGTLLALVPLVAMLASRSVKEAMVASAAEPETPG